MMIFPNIYDYFGNYLSRLESFLILLQSEPQLNCHYCFYLNYRVSIIIVTIDITSCLFSLVSYILEVNSFPLAPYQPSWPNLNGPDEVKYCWITVVHPKMGASSCVLDSVMTSYPFETRPRPLPPSGQPPNLAPFNLPFPLPSRDPFIHLSS